MSKLSPKILKERQDMPLQEKIDLSLDRIEEWYYHWGGKVYIAFSGGKDSTVLLNLVRKKFPDVPAVFCDTGVEFKEIRDFISTIPNVIYLKPKMTFFEVVKKYGYPVISKEQSKFIFEVRHTKSRKLKNFRLQGDENGRGKVSDKWKFLINAPFEISDRCCDILKKNPVHKFEKETGLHPFTGEMAYESQRRKTNYLMYGCNAFDAKRPVSRPLSFWTDSDVWEYLKTTNTPYSSIYDLGYTRTGCVWCLFGITQEGTPNKIQLLEKTHPKLHKYCIEKLEYGKILDYLYIPYTTEEGDE